MRRLFVATTIMLTIALGSLAGAGWEEGRAAWVRGDYETALREYRLAAEQGHAVAQTSLGSKYANGQGVPQNYILAHKWLNLAAAQGNETAIKGRNLTAERMTPAKIAEAQRLAAEWTATLGKQD